MALPKKRRSPRLTETIAAYIKWLWINTPLNQAQISASLGAINQGRVSEVVNGHRFADVKPMPFSGTIWNE
ncbi:hypothetical protein N9741_02385 [Octadecabacter sp.]|nr:hypothetical protein [Octadecabacter sp.]